MKSLDDLKHLCGSPNLDRETEPALKEVTAHIERMEMALRDAQRQFLYYERNHRAKVGDMATIVETQQRIEKAETNARMANICRDALADQNDPREKLWAALRLIRLSAVEAVHEGHCGTKYGAQITTFINAALAGAPDA